MNRTVLLLALLLTASASAAPRGWSAQVPANWAEDTVEVMASPGMRAFARQFTDRGDRFEGVSYSSPDGQVSFLVATVEPLAKPATLADIEDTETKGRARANQGATELTYLAERTPLTIGATQRVSGKATPMGNRRFIGLLASGHARVIAAVCLGDPATCDPLLASITIDGSVLVPLATLSPSSAPSSTGWWIGAVLGALAVAGLLVSLVRRRNVSS